MIRIGKWYWNEEKEEVWFDEWNGGNGFGLSRLEEVKLKSVRNSYKSIRDSWFVVYDVLIMAAPFTNERRRREQALLAINKLISLWTYMENKKL